MSLRIRLRLGKAPGIHERRKEIQYSTLLEQRSDMGGYVSKLCHHILRVDCTVEAKQQRSFASPYTQRSITIIQNLYFGEIKMTTHECEAGPLSKMFVVRLQTYNHLYPSDSYIASLGCYQMFIQCFYVADTKFSSIPGDEYEVDVQYFRTPRLVVYCLVRIYIVVLLYSICLQLHFYDNLIQLTLP